MAEKISWHCWVTKKCGISLAKKYFGANIVHRGSRLIDPNIVYNKEKGIKSTSETSKAQKTKPMRSRLGAAGWNRIENHAPLHKHGNMSRFEKNYQFIITRNPYNRLASFYINKIVFQGHSPERINRLFPYDNQAYGPVEYDIKEFSLGDDHHKHEYKIDSNISFREFIKFLKNLDFDIADQHLQPQWYHTENVEFDKVVKLENFDEDIKDVIAALEWPEIKKFERRNSFDFCKKDAFKGFVGDYPAEWFRKNPVPINYKQFYQDPDEPYSISNIVYRLYEKDFIKFEYDISLSNA